MSSGVAGVRKMILASGVRSETPVLLVKFLREFYHTKFGSNWSKKNAPCTGRTLLNSCTPC